MTRPAGWRGGGGRARARIVRHENPSSPRRGPAAAWRGGAGDARSGQEAAGEDIRYLPRHLATGIRLPEEDFWLVDDDKLILSVFSADGRTGGFAREDRPELVCQCL